MPEAPAEIDVYREDGKSVEAAASPNKPLYGSQQEHPSVTVNDVEGTLPLGDSEKAYEEAEETVEETLESDSTRSGIVATVHPPQRSLKVWRESSFAPPPPPSEEEDHVEVEEETFVVEGNEDGKVEVVEETEEVVEPDGTKRRFTRKRTIFRRRDTLGAFSLPTEEVGAVAVVPQADPVKEHPEADADGMIEIEEEVQINGVRQRIRRRVPKECPLANRRSLLPVMGVPPSTSDLAPSGSGDSSLASGKDNATEEHLVSPDDDDRLMLTDPHEKDTRLPTDGNSGAPLATHGSTTHLTPAQAPETSTAEHDFSATRGSTEVSDEETSSVFSDAPEAGFGEQVTACFDEGLLFRIVRDDVWAFYNATKTHEMHITFTFGKESELEGLGRSQIYRNTDGTWMVSTVCFPREQVPFIKGVPRGYQSSLRAKPLSDAYYEQVAATNAISIEEERHAMPTAIDSQNDAEVLSRCVEVGALFVDPVFPPYQSSIERGSSRRMKVVPWARPMSYVADPTQCALYREPVRPRSVGQGELGDSWIAGAIAALAEYPSAVYRMFTPSHHESRASREAQCGAYRVVLNKNGWWRSVILDSFLPVRVQAPLYIHNPQRPGELWAALLEKAYAKVHGSYGRIIAGDPIAALQDMTGFATARYDASLNLQVNNLGATNKDGKSPDRVFLDRLERYYRHGFVLLLNTPQRHRDASEEDTRLRDNGLSPGRCYTVRKIRRFPNGRSEIVMFEVSNPWGDLSKWRGEWRQGSPNWKLYPFVAEAIHETALMDAEMEAQEYEFQASHMRHNDTDSRLSPPYENPLTSINRHRTTSPAYPNNPYRRPYSNDENPSKFVGTTTNGTINSNLGGPSQDVYSVGFGAVVPRATSLWLSWSEVRQFFTGCGVLFHDPSCYDYRVRGEFHGKIPTVCLLITCTKKLNITFTLSMPDQRCCKVDTVQRNVGEPTSYVEEKRRNEYLSQPLYNPAADVYDPIMLSLAHCLDDNFEQMKVIHNSNLDPDLPTSFFSFMESRDVSLNVTLTPRKGPYFLIPRTLTKSEYLSYVIGIHCREPVGFGDFNIEFRNIPRESQVFDNFDQFTGKHIRPCVASFQVRHPDMSMPSEFTNLVLTEQNIVNYVNPVV